MSFTWEEAGYYRPSNDFYIDGGNLRTLLNYPIWESEVFGDWWEVALDDKTTCMRGPYLSFLKWTPLDRTRPLCLGETFRAVRRTPMTQQEKECRQRLIQEGAIVFQSHVSHERYEKALRELVWECVAIPVKDRTNLNIYEKLERFRHYMENWENHKEYLPGMRWPHIADLPALDSLVRASSEPMQAQEAVLLRAAEGQETTQEQLVHAVNGQE